MKKYILLGIVCTFLVTLITLIPSLTEKFAPTITTASPIKVPYHETVSGSGTIAYKAQNEITESVPLIINRVNVKEGDFVNLGQVVAFVDKNATLDMLAGLSKYKLDEIGAESLAMASEMIPREITSNYMGRVTFKVNDGEIVQSGQPILTLANSDELVANISVKENDIQKVKIGQKVELSGTAFDKYYGIVESVSTTARKNYIGTVAETVVDIVVKIENVDKSLRSGYNANAQIITEIPRDIYVLPYDVINQDDEGEYVYIVENGVAYRRNIITGIEMSDGTQILEGVAPNEKVAQNPSLISKNTIIKQVESIS